MENMHIKLGVDSSSRFSFRVQIHTDRQSHKESLPYTRIVGNKQMTTFLLLHRRADVSVLVPVDCIDDLIATTKLHFDDCVFEMRDTRVYLCRQSTIASVSGDVTAQVLHAQQQRLDLSACTLGNCAFAFKT